MQWKTAFRGSIVGVRGKQWQFCDAFLEDGFDVVGVELEALGVD